MALPASDTFSGTSGQDLPVYSSNWASVGPSSADCLECDGSGNARAATAGPDNGAKWTADSFNAAHYSETTVDPAAAGIQHKAGAAVRCGTAGNFYGAYADIDEIEIFKMVGSTWTQLGSTVTISWGTGTHTIRASMAGSLLTVTYDGVDTTRTDTSHSTGAAGVTAWSASGAGMSVITDWSADNLPAEPVSLASLGAKSAGVTASPLSVPYPSGIAAKDLILMGINAYNDTATVTTPASPWTAGAELTGGTGTAADSHTARAHVSHRQAVGTESGSQSVTLGGTISGALGIMAAYRLGNTSRNWDIAYATGTDDTHGANRSVTASTSLSLQPDDVLVAFVPVDTDVALTVTSPAFTATGITFATTTRSTSGAGVTSGNDGNVDMYEAKVTAGTATAVPTLAFTTATSQCGPVVFIRLRSVAAGGSAVTGTATAEITVNTATAGRRNVVGATATSIAVNTATVGQRGVLGAGVAALSINTVAAGRRAVFGAAAPSITISTVAVGRRGVLGQATTSITVNAAASGSVAGAVTGQATASITINTATAGRRAVAGASTATVSVLAAASGRRGVQGTATASLSLGTTAVGRRGVGGLSAGSISLSTTAAGRRGVLGQATATLSVLAAAAGMVEGAVSGAGAAEIVINASANGVGRPFLNYLSGPTGSASTPDPGPLPAQVTFVARISGPVTSPPATQTIVSQYEADPNRSWVLRRSFAGGFGNMITTPTGSASGGVSRNSPGSLTPVVVGADEWIAFAFDNTASSSLTAWTSPDGVAWTNRGTGAVGAAVTLFDSTSVVRVGRYGGGGDTFQGRIYSIECRTGLDPADGTLLWKFDASEYPGTGTSFTDPRGRTWTLSSASTIVLGGDAGQGSARINVNASANGVVGHNGAATASIQVLTTGGAQVGRLGAATASIDIQAAAIGQRGVRGSAFTMLSVDAASQGTVVSPVRVYGAASAVIYILASVAISTDTTTPATRIYRPARTNRISVLAGDGSRVYRPPYISRVVRS